MSFTQAIVEAGGEALPCVWRGPQDGAPLLVLQPMFEEMNRTRRLIARTTAGLANRGVRSCLPDLPGTGDHGGVADWERWRSAAEALGKAMDGPHLLAVRGGALLADAVGARSIYALAPVRDGDRPVRDLLRARLAADREAGLATTMVDLDEALARDGVIEAAGYALGADLVLGLRATGHGNNADTRWDTPPTRTVATAAGADVDAVIAGPRVWLNADGADPAEVDAFARALAEDIAGWIMRCDRRD